jgi:hypothetical protein
VAVYILLLCFRGIYFFFYCVFWEYVSFLLCILGVYFLFCVFWEYICSFVHSGNIFILLCIRGIYLFYGVFWEYISYFIVYFENILFCVFWEYISSFIMYSGNIFLLLLCILGARRGMPHV